MRAIGDRPWEGAILRQLGLVHLAQGRSDDAATCLNQSLAAFREIGFRGWEARALDSLGVLLAAKGDLTAAHAAWQPALAIFQELGMPEAAAVASRL